MDLLTWIRVQWDRAGAIFALVVGGLSLFLGWLGVTNTPHVAKQLPYIASGGLFGIFLVGVAATLWISADLRDEWRELRGIREELHAANELVTSSGRTATLAAIDEAPARTNPAPRARARRASVAMSKTTETTETTLSVAARRPQRAGASQMARPRS